MLAAPNQSFFLLGPRGTGKTAWLAATFPGLTRNLAAFARFLETASFSQASVLNMAGVARESGIGAKAAEDYFTILEDLLIAVRLPAAWNDYGNLGYSISYWRTPGGEEVDFVLYGKRGFFAVEVKRSARIRAEDLKGLLQFHRDYPQAKLFLFHAGARRWHESGVEIVPLADALKDFAGIFT